LRELPVRFRAPQARSDIAAAFWASLGLSPETAQQNLQKCRVRIQSIDVQGETELGAALSELGVRVVKRSPNLTVTLVNDYLEARLAELNQQHLTDRTPWVLVQPSGIFPLVGPVFRPEQSACWTCLAERMKRNREIKALLDRRDARCVAVSPLAQQTFGQTAIQLAAVEVAKAIATDFRTQLSDHIISLDLMGSTIVKHHVAARPQCPSCGRKKLRDPRRAPAPVELGAGGKVVMTSGGYRSVSSSATVARFRRHVSPLTGVVSRLERIQADLPLNTNYYATHNFSGPAETVHELRSGLGGGSFGKGSTAEQGEASALGQRERTAGHRMLQRRGQSSRGHFDDRAAAGAHRVMVRVGCQTVGGHPALQGQRMQHTLVDQGDHRAVDRRQVRRLVFGRQALVQPLIDLGNGQVTVDRLQHCQDCDPGGHPAQPMSAQQFADPLDDGRIQSRGPGHSSSITQPIVESHPMTGSDAVRLTSCPICRQVRSAMCCPPRPRCCQQTGRWTHWG